MRALGYKVFVLNPTTITGIYQDISFVGRATGAETQATAVIENITSSNQRDNHENRSRKHHNST